MLMNSSAQTRLPNASSLFVAPPDAGERKNLNSELWHACAGPLVSLPAIGSRVVYLPQGHSEQVAASTQKEADAHIPAYPNLPPQLICQLHDVILHADMETDEVYCQMTLQPITGQEKESSFVPDMGSQSRQPNVFFCKTLTASDTSTHGGFSIPRRAAEKVFPPLNYSQQPPAQELAAHDLHDTEWKFRHIYRGQPKRHLLTTGWSVFVSAKRLTAGDSVLFIRNEKGQLLLGIRRANRPQTVLPSSVLSSDSMHIGVLAAAAHAANTNSRFTVFYNPRASPSEFVIPYTKFEKAVYHTRVSVGMRFRMLFETEESSVRRYMGTITGICDLDPVRWPNSQWRSIKVGWDESTACERQRRVSLWEIEPLTTFLVYPPTTNWRLKHPWPQPVGASFSSDLEMESLKQQSMWMPYPNPNNGMAMNPLLGSIQRRPDSTHESDIYGALGAAALQEIFPSKQLNFQQHPPGIQADQMFYRQQQAAQFLLHPQEQPLLQTQQPFSQQLQHQSSSPQPLPQQQLHHQSSPQSLPTQQLHHPSSPQSLPQQLPQQSPPQSVVPQQLQHQSLPQQLQHQALPQLQNQSLLHQLPHQSLSQQVHHQPLVSPQLHHQPLPQQQVHFQSLQQHHQLLPQSLPQQLHHQSLPQSLPPQQLHHQSLPQSLPSPTPPQHQQLHHQSLPPSSQHQQTLHHQQIPQQMQASSSMPQPTSPFQCLPYSMHPRNTNNLLQQAQQQQKQKPQLISNYSPSPQHTPPTAQVLQVEQVQQQPSSSPNIATILSRMPSSQPQGPLNSTIAATQSTLTDSNASLTSTGVSQTLQSIFSGFSSETNPLNDNSVPTSHAVLNSSISTNGLKGELIDTTRPLDSSSTLSNFSSGLPSNPYGYKDFPEEMHSELISSRNSFGGNGDFQPGMMMTMPSSLPSPLSKAYNATNDQQNQCIMQNTSSVLGIEPHFGSSMFNGGLDDSRLVQSFSPVTNAPLARTYTKVYKTGSVGRSLDVTRFSNYDELRREVAKLFMLEGQLEDTSSGWQLIFVDKENDWLLLGDDPWEVFINNVRSFRILSPSEAFQMRDGVGLLPMQRQTSSSSEDGTTQQDSRNPSSVITSTCSFDY